MSNRDAKIGIIYTGGTIGGSGLDLIDGKLDEQAFLKMLVEKEVVADTDKIEFRCPLVKFSECMMPSDWPLIAREVASLLSEVSGVIVLHGTDTLCYTAAAVAFMLGDVPVPVMFTGANIPFSREGSDAQKNIVDSISAVRSGEFSGVCICFAGEVHSAVRTRKVRTSGNSYESVGCSPLGSVVWSAVASSYAVNTQNAAYYQNVKKASSFLIDSNVSLYKMYPGFMASSVSNDNSKAIILELYNDGTGPVGLGDSYSLDVNIAKIDKPVFATSQQLCSVELDTYGSSGELRKAGLTGLKTMLTEVAIVKLMWLLGCGFKGQQLKDKMLEDIRGEFGFDNE
ncbi:MAG: asparaginase domain-containing protein [Sedimentisphaeraceae bacterium JB056]